MNLPDSARVGKLSKPIVIVSTFMLILTLIYYNFYPLFTTLGSGKSAFIEEKPEINYFCNGKMKTFEKFLVLFTYFFINMSIASI